MQPLKISPQYNIYINSLPRPRGDISRHAYFASDTKDSEPRIPRRCASIHQTVIYQHTLPTLRNHSFPHPTGQLLPHLKTSEGGGGGHCFSEVSSQLPLHFSGLSTTQFSSPDPYFGSCRPPPSKILLSQCETSQQLYVSGGAISV